MDVTPDNLSELLTQDVENSDPQAADIQMQDDEETEMSDLATGLLLDEIQKKKKELHDPRHRRNIFFPEIRERLIERGLCFSAKTIEKKFYSLKKSFDLLCQSKNRTESQAKRPISWQYFEKMMGIFSEELQIEDAPTMASLYPDLPLPRTSRSLHIKKKSRSQPKQSESDSSSVENSDEESEQDLKKKETVWDNHVVVAFLNELIARKKDFWDPCVRRGQIFEDIQSRMLVQGYTFAPDSLNQKLRNLKVRYLVIMKNIEENNKDKQARVRWPFFTLMHQIYDGCADRDMRRKLAEPISEPTNGHGELDLESKSVNPSPEKANEENPTSSSKYLRRKRRYLDMSLSSSFQENFQNTISALTSESQTSINCPLSLEDFGESCEDNKEPTTEEPIDAKPHIQQTPQDDITNDSEFAQKLLALEERRTIAIEQLLGELTESNRIREERLKFNRMKLEYLKTRQNQ